MPLPSYLFIIQKYMHLLTGERALSLWYWNRSYYWIAVCSPFKFLIIFDKLISGRSNLIVGYVMCREYNILKISFVCTDLFIGDLQTLIYIIAEYRMWPTNYLYKRIINSPALSLLEISNVVVNYVREYAGTTISYL